MTPAEQKKVAKALGDRVICERCGATLSTYDAACTAALDDPCPGFVMIERAMSWPPTGGLDNG